MGVGSDVLEGRQDNARSREGEERQEIETAERTAAEERKRQVAVTVMECEECRHRELSKIWHEEEEGMGESTDFSREGTGKGLESVELSS